jgi:hypothetical protein
VPILIRAKHLLVLLVMGIAGAIAWAVADFAIDSQRIGAEKDRQLSTLSRLNQYRPPGWTENEWENAIPYNIWGNAVMTYYHPPSSDFETLAKLELGLNQIMSSTSSTNSVESIDRLYRFLLGQLANNSYASVVRAHHTSYLELVKSKQDSEHPEN